MLLTCFLHIYLLPNFFFYFINAVVACHLIFCCTLLWEDAASFLMMDANTTGLSGHVQVWLVLVLWCSSKVSLTFFYSRCYAKFRWFIRLLDVLCDHQRASLRHVAFSYVSSDCQQAVRHRQQSAEGNF